MIQAFTQTLAYRNIPLDHNLKVGRLDNGLTYYLSRDPSRQNQMSIRLLMKVGADQEDQKQQGYAHAIEHLAFSTKSFPNAYQYFKDKVQIVGFTSYDHSGLGCENIPSKDSILIKDIFSWLKEIPSNINIDYSRIKREREVITLENLFSDTSSTHRATDHILQNQLTGESGYTMYSIHDRLSDKHLDEKEFNLFYKTWYKPELMAIIVEGDFDNVQIEKEIRLLFSSFSYSNLPIKHKSYSAFNWKKFQLLKIPHHNQEKLSIQIQINHPYRVIKTIEDYEFLIKSVVFNKLISQRFREIRKVKYMPKMTGTFLQHGSRSGPDYSYFVSYLEVSRIDSLKQSLKKGINQLKRISNFGFTTSEWSQLKSEMIKSKLNLFHKGIDNHFVYGESIPSEYFQGLFERSFIDNLTIHEINEFASDILNEDNLSVIIKSPEDLADKLPDEASILAWIGGEPSHNSSLYKEKKDSIPYKIDFTNSEELVDLVSEEYFLELGHSGKTIVEPLENSQLTKVILSNGINVIIMPKEHSTKVVHFKSFSHGGTHVYVSQKEQWLASKVSEIALGSGLGNLNGPDFKRFCAQKSISVKPFIHKDFEGINAYSSTESFEELLQSIHLLFRKNSLDEKAFLNTINYEHTTSSPKNKNSTSYELHVKDSLLADVTNSLGKYVVYSDNRENLKLKDAESIYRQKFNNPTNFTFVLTGISDNPNTINLLEHYLGSLTTHSPIEQIKPKSQILKEAQYREELFTINNEGQLGLISKQFYFEHEESLQEKVLIEAVSAALDIALYNRLRLEEAGAYVVGVYSDKLSSGIHSITPFFRPKVGKMDSMLTIMEEEIYRLKIHGPSEDELSILKQRLPYLFSKEFMADSFWSNHLINQLRFGHDIDINIDAKLKSLINKITIDNIKKASSLYLNPKRSLLFLIKPKHMDQSLKYNHSEKEN